MFNHHGFRDQVRLSGVNSINWARIVAQVVYYFTAAAALGAPRRQLRLRGADRQLRRHLCRLCRAAYGSAGGSAGRRDQRQRHPRAHAGQRHLRGARRGRRPRRRRWTSRCRRASSGCCLRPCGRDPASVRGADGFAGAVRAFLVGRCFARAISASCSPRGRAGEDETAATIRTVLRETGILSRSVYGVGARCFREKTRRPAIRRCPMVVLGTAHAGEIPRCREARAACGRPVYPNSSAIFPNAASASRRAARRSGVGRAVHPGGKSCRA